MAVATIAWFMSKDSKMRQLRILDGEKPKFSTTKYLYVGTLNYSTPTGIPPMNPNHVIDENYRVWVAGGFVATDFALADVPDWNANDTVKGRRLTEEDQLSTISIKDTLMALMQKVDALEKRVQKQEDTIELLKEARAAGVE